LLLRRDGSVHEIGTPGLLLGAEADPPLVDTVVELRPADCVLLYTDGLTDAYVPARTLGPADVRALLGSCAGLSADASAEYIYRSVLELGRTEPRDDIALVVLRIATTDTCPTPDASPSLSRRR
jgi:serine phosphatase RsbU (regulator of sigma subunit)